MCPVIIDAVPLQRKGFTRSHGIFHASLAMAEMIRGGTTTINDMYFYHDAMARAGLATKINKLISIIILS